MLGSGAVKVEPKPPGNELISALLHGYWKQTEHKFEDGVPMTAELSLRSIQKASDSAYIATSGDISCTCGFMVRVFTGS